MSRGTVCIFAKPPRAGQAKTRLAPALGPGTAAIAEAFLRDTLAMARALPWRLVVASTEHDPEGLDLIAGEALWMQGPGDLGDRMQRVLGRALQSGPFALALGADSPGLPGTLVRRAVELLDDHDAVLGPTPDGGYYLLGLRTCPEGLLSGLPWSAPDTLQATLQRLAQHDLSVALLPPFFDVDEPADLARLAGFLRQHPTAAPHTRAALAATANPPAPWLSVILPVLDEAKRIGQRLEELGRMPGIDEIIVVDGGSGDGTPEIVSGYPQARLIEAKRGRASQLNAGAAVATGEVLLFLHADVSLPATARGQIEAVLARPGVVAGAFRTWTIDDTGSHPLRALLHLADVRSRITRHPYGDQGLFVPRALFDELGGFPDQDLLEDYELSRRLAARGLVGLAPGRVHVSGRRFLHRPLYYTAVMWTWPALYRWGVPTSLLNRWYGAVR